MELFPNPHIGKCVCIDWDLYCRDFVDIAIPYAISLIQFVSDRTGLEIKAYYQESASGNVHVALKFNQNITALDAFLIRAWMGDDETRLRLDLARYMKSGSLHEMNRCFQDKIRIKDGQANLTSAGPWIRLEGEENQLPAITTQEAHALISRMQEECLKRKMEVKKECNLIESNASTEKSTT